MHSIKTQTYILVEWDTITQTYILIEWDTITQSCTPFLNFKQPICNVWLRTRPMWPDSKPTARYNSRQTRLFNSDTRLHVYNVIPWLLMLSGVINVEWGTAARSFNVVWLVCATDTVLNRKRSTVFVVILSYSRSSLRSSHQ